MEFIVLQNELYARIQRAQINFKKSPKSRLKKNYLEPRLTELESTWSQFKTNHFKIVLDMKNTENEYFAEDKYNSTEEIYLEYRAELMDVLDALEPYTPESSMSTNTKRSTTTHSVIAEVKLPPITIPTFSGNYNEWSTFHDLFVSLIDKNEALGEVQKLHYLKSYLCGEAEQLLRHIAINDSNYNYAWLVLKKRYSNKKYLANNILKRFTGQKLITVESSKAIKELLDTTMECMNALDNIGISTNNWDTIIIHLVVAKLDPETHKQWQHLVNSSDIDVMPTLKEFEEFLELRFRTLEMLEPTIKNNNQYQNKVKSLPATIENIVCVFCSGAHVLAQCSEFSKLTTEKRQEFVKEKKLCYNCLLPNHPTFHCRNKSRCQKCQRRHHSLLHSSINTHFSTVETSEDSNEEQLIETTEEHPSTSSMEVLTHFSRDGCLRESHTKSVLLPTAIVKAVSKNGQPMLIRAFIDQGSQASFITEATVQLLGLKKTPVNGIVSGLGEGSTLHTKNMVQLSVNSRFDSTFTLEVRAYVLTAVTSLLPTKEISIHEWPELVTLSLADPDYAKPKRVDILLGSDVYAQLLIGGIIKNTSGNLIAQNTHLGWILSGSAPDETIPLKTFTNIVSLHIQLDNDILKQFWEIESDQICIKKKVMSKEEELCEEIYNKSTYRNETGRYVVNLPFRDGDPTCQYGNSRPIAMKRLQYLERKFKNDLNFKLAYDKVLEEYVELGHMKSVSNPFENPKAVYLPHHAIVKQDRLTSKVRVVFDASCKGSNKVSLNDNLMVGPTLQQDLRHIIMRWRLHKIALIADLVKMYRQINVTEDHQDFQRILWRRNQEIEDFKLLTVTFGTASAPYLAVKTLMKLAEDESHNYPKAAEITKTDFYMDDLLTGAEDEIEALEIYNQMNSLMISGKFELQKWASNSSNVLNQIGKEIVTTSECMKLKIDDVMKVLGLRWNIQRDEFFYTVNLPEINYSITKRTILADVARLFDPLGWIAPVIITGKVFIQKLWLSGVGWDDKVPEDLKKSWLQYRSELINIQNIHIPRWIYFKSKFKTELHGFADASSIAYAAVVYIRVTNDKGDVYVTLVTAKTKVAPIRQRSIPILELCGMSLLAKILAEVSNLLKVPKESVFAWTDSSVVLAWLCGHPNRWKTYVGNRVSEILDIINNDQIHHVKSEDNPADCASRGVKPQHLVSHPLWWAGPSWLKNKTLDIKKEQVPPTTLEQRKIKVMLSRYEIDFLTRFSSLRKLLRVLVYVRRVRYPTSLKFISRDEIREILKICLKIVQQNEYKTEIESLNSKETVKRSSKLHTLCPFLDQDGLLRVGGRLQQSGMPYDTKHPIILPNNSHLTKLIVADSHDKTLHGGPQLMHSYLRTKYWIIGAKPMIKKQFRNCIICVRHAAATRNPLMGQLPSVRLEANRPFLKSGLDYAGPINMRMSHGRGCKTYKGYICLFVCMVTKAIHLEAVSDLTSKGFIAAFKRFTARRGHCSDIYSDNGSNFVGANKELKKMLLGSQSSVSIEIAESLATDGTSWHFIPPNSPNFGGLWESGIKSVKSHLFKLIANTTLTFEEMTTILTQIEACLNSRPLWQIPDSNELVPLTPGHFLIGESIITVPSDNYDNTNISTLSRWQRTQKIVQEFWKRWSREYLNNMQQRYKWFKLTPEPDVGDVVIVIEDGLPPAKWRLGRIIQKHPGPDNITRVVTVRSKNFNFKRPISKLCVLPKA